MVRTRDDIVSTLRQRRADLCCRYPIRRIALFGSWARGEQAPGSDVDILVDVAPSIGWDFVSLAEELEQLLGVKVDLISTRAIRPALWEEIEPELIDA
jgi:predicted nucleotidyltransferase